MSDTDETEHARRGAGTPILLITIGALAIANAAAWFYFRQQQPKLDERTRDRLRPRRGA
jgi:hypothetical protein